MWDGVGRVFVALERGKKGHQSMIKVSNDHRSRKKELERPFRHCERTEGAVEDSDGHMRRDDPSRHCERTERVRDQIFSGGDRTEVKQILFGVGDRSGNIESSAIPPKNKN